MLKTKGPQKWVWEERKKQQEINFRFKDTSNPEDLVVTYAGMMQVTKHFWITFFIILKTLMGTYITTDLCLAEDWNTLM